ncbi:MAG: PEP-CTERM sorting domain-containing protein [Phycisphaerae bacterium]
MRKMSIALVCILTVAMGSAAADMVIEFENHGLAHDTPLVVGENSYVGGQLEYGYDINGPARWNVEDQEGIYFGSAWGDPGTSEHAMLWSTGGSYTFDGMDGDDLAIRLNRQGSLSIGDNWRGLIENAGTVYVSATLAANPGLFDELAYTKDDLAATTWSEFNLATASLVSDGATTTLADMDDITGMGLAISPSGGNIYVNTFEAYAVPEPASMGLLAVGGLAVLRRRRRK